MSTSQNAYGRQAWGQAGATPPWGQAGPGFAGRGPAFLDGLPRPVVIGMTVLAFMLWWPVGLATLCYMLGSGRLGARWRREAMPAQAPWRSWANWATGATGAPGHSGNHAFDEYKMQTLQRLEEEQQEFGAFLERLRFAKDKAEFDQFMAERRSRPPVQPNAPEQEAA